MVPLRLVRSASVVVGLAAVVGPAAGQVTTLYNSNGFSNPTYTAGVINNQQGFAATPPVPPFVPNTTFAGIIQNGVTFGGTGQAFQIDGGTLVDSGAPPFGFHGGNFWYQTRPATGAGSYSPVADGKPFVQAQARVFTTGAIPNAGADMPFAGIYLEGYNTSNVQQAISPLMVNINGGLTVFTNQATGGNNLSVATADGLLSRENWHQILIQFNFNVTGPGAQTMRVYVNGSSTPVQFTLNGNNQPITPITDVPFRNSTNLPTVSIAEIGMLGFYGRDPFTQQPYQPLNDFYIDDYTVMATVAPVPEPGWLVAVGFAGTAVGTWWRRRRAG